MGFGGCDTKPASIYGAVVPVSLNGNRNEATVVLSQTAPYVRPNFIEILNERNQYFDQVKVKSSYCIIDNMENVVNVNKKELDGLPRDKSSRGSKVKKTKV